MLTKTNETKNGKDIYLNVLTGKKVLYLNILL